MIYTKSVDELDKMLADYRELQEKLKFIIKEYGMRSYVYTDDISILSLTSDSTQIIARTNDDKKTYYIPVGWVYLQGTELADQIHAEWERQSNARMQEKERLEYEEYKRLKAKFEEKEKTND